MPGINSRPAGRPDTDYNNNPEFFSDEAFQGEYTGTNLIYKGFARPGGDLSLPVWQIAFLTYDVSNNVLSIQWPLKIATTSIQTQDVGGVTTPWATFSGTLAPAPIAPGTVTITVGAITFTDQAQDGTLTGNPSTNTGTINYTNGDITLAFSPDLLGDTEVFATFGTWIFGGASNDYEFVWNLRALYTYV